jgi:outer membrane receptor protein involved in Fe transport
MNDTLRLRSLLAIGVSAAALVAAAPALAQTAGQGAAGAKSSATTVGEIIVTAERKEESLQSTPVAVSAFNEAKLKVQRLDGGQNLVISIPNVNYSRENFGGYNFAIRGVGTKTVGAGGTAGVSINENELPVAANHFADTDFYDMQRVEVLRGPQGTLYGRNSTGGAVNLITNQPTDTFNGSISAEYGNYNDRKVTGFINLPLGDMFALRVAGYGLARDGFGTNSVTGDKIDGRNLGSGRITLSFKPNDRFSAYLLYEHFGESDTRNRVGKQLCIKDEGPATVGGVNTSALDREFLTQGCKAGSLYQNAAYGTVNTSGTLGGELTNELGLTSGDVMANHPFQNHNLHDIESAINPLYRAHEDLALLHLSWHITDNLTLTSITGYNRNVTSSAEDYNRLVPQTSFNPTPDHTSAVYQTLASLGQGAAYDYIYSQLFPNGYVNDPQTGVSNKINSFDYANDTVEETTEELRLSSSFKGPVNFSVGAYYNDTETPQGSNNYYVESSSLTAFSRMNNALGGLLVGGPIVIDQAYPPTGAGHNYYDARFGGGLKSTAAFGELYWDITPDVKLTLGARYTQDQLKNTQYPILTLAPGGGFPNTTCPTTGTVVLGSCLVQQNKTWQATTGRVNLDWTPTLPFTDKTLVYATYSRGYKGGGFNTPCQNSLGSAGGGGGSCGYALVFQPEFIDAFEVGTKNTLAGGTITLNADAFYYNYKNYQVSQIIAESSVNQNFNAKIYGVEFEGVWSPVRNLVFNANIGYLHTEITGGSSVDSLNITQGNPAYTLVKTGAGANCMVDSVGVGALIASGLGGAALTKLCDFTGAGDASQRTATAQSNYNAFLVSTLEGLGDPAPVAIGTANALAGDGTALNPGALFNYGKGCTVDGCATSLKGKQLPNAPEWTISIGAQYRWELADDWKVTLRGDYYWQDQSYARVYNAINDRLHSWDNVNATLNFEKSDWGLTAQLWVKNALNKQPLTDVYVTDPTSGLFQNTFTLDPRTYGLTLTKTF